MHARVLAALTLLTLPGLGTADTTLEYAREGSTTPGSVMLIAHGRMRVDDPGTPDSAVIFDPAAQTMTLLDAAKRSYTVLDAATMQQLGARIAQARAQMQEALAGMPPEQRAQMEQMMGGMPGADAAPPAPVYERSGRSETAGGRRCTVVEFRGGSAGAGELCVVPEDELDLPAADRETLRGVAALARQFSAHAQQQGFGAQLDLEALGGFPVRSKMGDAPADVLVRISREALAAERFAVPAGYTRQPFMPAP